MTWWLMGWGAAAVLELGALAWASRYRRDRHRPTGGWHTIFDGMTGLDEIWSRDTYDADKPHVVIVVRASIIAALALFIMGFLLSLGSR